MALWLFPMTQDQFEEVSEAVAERLKEHVRQTYEYFTGMFPGLQRHPGPQRLAFYRTTDQLYWDQLTKTNPMQAKLNVIDWIALSRRETRP